MNLYLRHLGECILTGKLYEMLPCRSICRLSYFYVLRRLTILRFVSELNYLFSTLDMYEIVCTEHEDVCTWNDRVCTEVIPKCLE